MIISVIDIAAQAKIYAIQCVITSVANWRETTAEKFPDDPRNFQAAGLLRAIAAERADTLPAELIAKLAALTGSTTAPARELAQKVGFKEFPDSLTAFVEELLKSVGGGR